MNVLKYLTLYLFFPGFFFSFILSIFVGYFDRKLTARLQYRQGPPLLQNLYDFLKLMSKELVIPDTANLTFFMLLPIFGFACIILAATILWNAIFFKYGFVGDIIVFIYLLTVPSIMLLLSSSSTGNIIASIGVAREIKMLLSYELPLITALIVPILKTNSLKLTEIFINNKFSLSNLISFIVVLLCMHAKLGLVPFDAQEAETELAGGILIEHSGILLGFIKLTKQVMLTIIPAFLAGVYFYSKNLIIFFVIYLVILILITLIRNTNPRLKIRQVIKFFWFGIFPISLISIVLYLLGY